MAGVAHNPLVEGRRPGAATMLSPAKGEPRLHGKAWDLVKVKSGWENHSLTPLLNGTNTKSLQTLDWFLFAMQKCSIRISAKQFDLKPQRKYAAAFQTSQRRRMSPWNLASLLIMRVSLKASPSTEFKNSLLTNVLSLSHKEPLKWQLR